MKLLLFVCVLNFQLLFAQQKEVAITIDDVPNVALYKKDGFSSLLLKKLSDQSVPVAIFINEKKIYNNDMPAENLKGLINWIKAKNVTACNHSFSHLNYADTTLQAFEEDVIKGEVITGEILRPLNQKLTYFRFPFNSLGKDSLSHQTIKLFLEKKGYTIVPFTIESEDWMYSALYDEALKNKNKEKARQLGEQYVSVTLNLFNYFEKLCLQRFGRNLRQIYLCHDNQLNTDFLGELVSRLRKKGYSFITLDKAMQDRAYNLPDFYYGSAGMSWIYRWEPNVDKRRALQQVEPDNKILHAEYDQLKGTSKNK